MSRQSWFFVLFVLLSCCGCDPVRTTYQHVILKVVDSSSGSAVADAQVLIKYDLERASPMSDVRLLERQEQMPWHIGVTDANGQANIFVKSMMLDRNRNDQPPNERSLIDDPYLVRVEINNQQVQEQLSITMRRGSSSMGTYYNVKILEIKEPRYAKH